MTGTRLPWRVHAGALLALGLPIVGSHLTGFLIHVSDSVMLGWYGVDELAAVVIAGSFWFITFIVGSGFGTALPALVANARAQGDERHVRRAARMAMWLTLGYSVLVSPVFLFSEHILLAAGQPPEVARLGADYLMIAGWSIIPGLMTNLLRAYVAALGRPTAPLVAAMIGFVLHILINIGLIFGHWGLPELGIRGAAISTLVSDSVICLMLLVYATRRFPEYELLSRFWRPDPEMLSRLFHLGWPIGAQMLAEVGLFVGAAIMMGWVSAEMLAAHGIAVQLSGMTFLVHLGVSNAATIRAGDAAGRRDERLLFDGALTAVVLSMGFALVTMVIFFSIPEQLVRLFLDPSDPATPRVVQAGVLLVTMSAIFQLADGGQATAIGLLRGVQDTRVPMVLAAIGYWVIGLPIAYVLGFPMGYGGVGVWSGLVAGLAVVWLALSWRFWAGPMRRVAAPGAHAAQVSDPA